MKGLIVAPRSDSIDSSSPHDVTGEFRPKALEFQRIHRLADAPVFFDNNTREGNVLLASYGVVLGIIQRARGPLDFFAYFGHGARDRLLSANIGPGHIPRFVELLREKAPSAATQHIIFYACSAGSPGGFAERVSTAMGANAVVFGHVTAGPSCANPSWVRFPGGARVIPEGDTMYGAWVTALRETNLWARFPWMSDAELRSTLSPTAASSGR